MLADTRRASHQTGAMSRCAIVLLALSTLSQAAGADAQGPGVRTSHVLVYHEGLQRVVMITGNRVDTTETIWAWDGAAWTPAAVDGPPRSTARAACSCCTVARPAASRSAIRGRAERRHL